MAPPAPGGSASAPSFRLSAEAREDLREIARYIATDNPQAAHRMMAQFQDAFVRLGEMPHLGRERPELADALRVVSGYRHLPALFD